MEKDTLVRFFKNGIFTYVFLNEIQHIGYGYTMYSIYTVSFCIEAKFMDVQFC
jgi:hypothetical protein